MTPAFKYCLLFTLIILLFISSCKDSPSDSQIINQLPKLSTTAISEITMNSVSTGGSIISKGSSDIISKGICWAVNPNPTIDNNKTDEGIGNDDFQSKVSGLFANTTYYLRAYATNNIGTAYGNELSFTTLETDTGLNAGKIENLIRLIQNGTFPKVHSLLIIRNDILAVEKYFNGYSKNILHTMQSVTKSFTSAFVGIAVDKNMITSVDNTILSYFPQYTNIKNMSEWKKRIRIKDLLTMRSGTDYEEHSPNNPHDQLNQLSSGWDIFYLNRPMISEPGTQFLYDSGGVILLSSILKNAWGNHADVFADEFFFPQLGITQKQWYKNDDNHPHTGGGLYLKPTDMIKLGQLYLNNGKWQNNQIISEEWIKKSFEMQVDLTSAGDEYIVGYGYLWWILKPAFNSETKEYIYAAIGTLGQYIFIIPEYNMVVAVTGGATNHQSFVNSVKFLYENILDAVE